MTSPYGGPSTGSRALTPGGVVVDQQILTDLECALIDLRNKALRYTLLWAYYAGDAPKKWLTNKHRELFRELADDIGTDNWVEVAVNEPVQRLAIQSWSIEGSKGHQTDNHAFDGLWSNSSAAREEDDIYRSIGVVNEAFVFATKDTIGGPIDFVHVPAVEVHWPRRVKFDPRYVVRVWKDTETLLWRASLWYRDVVYRFVGPSHTGPEGFMSTPDISKFELDTENAGGPHGFDRVPCVRLTGPKAKSLAATVVPNQDRINKLTANKMVAAEFAAFPQRYILTHQALTEKSVTISPEHVMVLSPGGGEDAAPTSVGSFSVSELRNYDDSIQQELMKLFSRASLPKHLFGDSSSGQSAKAIRADEGPLVNLVKSMQEAAEESFEELAELAGYGDVTPVWRPAETPDDETTMNSVALAVQAGMPLKVALKYVAGWDEERLAEIPDPDTFGPTVDNLTKLGLAAQAGGLDPAIARQVGMQSLGVHAAPQPPQEGAPKGQ